MHRLLIAMLTLFAAAFAGFDRVGAQEAQDAIEADLATHHVAVKTDFAGVRVLLFGAVSAQGTEPLKRDIIIVVRGPGERLKVRQKKRIAGIWVNAASAVYPKVPGYYAVISNKPALEIASGFELQKHGIGFRSLRAQVFLSAPYIPRDEANDYADAIVRIMKRDKLYQEVIGGVSFAGRHLFRAQFELPANVPLGEYEADVFIFRAGNLSGKYSTRLTIEKAGIERLIYEMAHNQPLLYGILSVLVAVMAGVAAAAVFGKK